MPKTKKQKPAPTVYVTGSTIRMKQANTRDRTPRQNPLVVVAPDELVGGFIDFIRDHAVVGLAVGFVIATQVQTLVKQLVSSFITPTFQLFFSGTLSSDAVKWHFRGHETSYQWGVFFSDFLDFVFVLVAIYLIIRFFRLDKLDRAKPSK
jgi:large-conductance mechanosensitive channel